MEFTDLEKDMILSTVGASAKELTDELDAFSCCENKETFLLAIQEGEINNIALRADLCFEVLMKIIKSYEGTDCKLQALKELRGNRKAVRQWLKLQERLERTGTIEISFDL